MVIYVRILRYHTFNQNAYNIEWKPVANLDLKNLNFKQNNKLLIY